MNSTIAEFDITYAYNQFFIFDESSGRSIPLWTEQHSRQGFSRGLSAAAFITLDQWGIGHVKVHSTPFAAVTHFERLITVPFFAQSGRIAIQGPEDPPPMLFSIGKGHFRLWVGQYLIKDEEECIEVYFQESAMPVEKSEIVIKDDYLQPGAELLED
jgi:hypothetical protein